MKSKILRGVFMGISASWMLVVIDRTSTWEATQAWGLALIGAGTIAAVGLRLVTILDTRWAIRESNASGTRPVAVCNDPLVYHSHREPYLNTRG